MAVQPASGCHKKISGIEILRLRRLFPRAQDSQVTACATFPGEILSREYHSRCRSGRYTALLRGRKRKIFEDLTAPVVVQNSQHMSQQLDRHYRPDVRHKQVIPVWIISSIFQEIDDNPRQDAVEFFIASRWSRVGEF